MPDLSKYRFAKSHEWVLIEGGTATIGITDHAQEELGDVALVLLPDVGRLLQTDEKFGEIESIKAVSDLYTPVGGAVCAVNERLNSSPELVNDDPVNEGWMIKVDLNGASLPEGLMDSAEYELFLQGS